MAAHGGYRPGAGRKPNLDKPKRAETKVPPRPPMAPVPAEPRRPMVTAELLERIMELGKGKARERQQLRSAETTPYRIPWFPSSAIPKDRPKALLAMDNMPAFADANTAWIGAGGFAAEGLVFLGYTYLAELAQRPEYRTMAETIADDATREWLSFDVVGDEKEEAELRNKDPEGYEERQQDPDEMKKRVKAAGKEDRVKAIVDDQERLEVRDRFYWGSTMDSFMGRSHLYLQIGDTDFNAVQGEMAADIGNGRDETSRTKVNKDRPLKYIKTVEPMWSYPMAYNAQNPLSPDWYNPQQWYVMGREIHISRLQTFLTRPVPDMLKPAYAFGGLPLSQIAKPYVDIWLDTRQSVADLIRSFSTMVLSTDLGSQTAPGAGMELLLRIALYNTMRDNQGLFVVNKNTEEMKNVSAPLGGLHELQAQAQEHMLSVSRIPAVKFTGIQPSGLNASSDGEIKVYDDTIKAYQKRSFDPILTRILNFQMLSLFGEVDSTITHRWNALRQLTDAEKAEQKKKEADWYDVLVQMGSFSPAEVRGVVINDPESPFAGLNPDDVPEPPQQPGMEGMEGEEPPGNEEDDGGGPSEAGGAPGGAQDRDPFGGTKRNRYHDVELIADDEGEFKEGDHPRDESGKFTSGGGGGAKSAGGKGGMPSLPDFLKHGGSGSSGWKGGASSQKLTMPQFGLTPAPSSWSYKPKPFPKSEGKPKDASSVVVFSQGNESAVKSLNGKAFKEWTPPSDTEGWAKVEGQAKIDEPDLPELPKGMSLSSGVIIREPDGRVWMVRPTGGYGGYEQTFPKGGVEKGLSPQANAIKEAFEESGLKVKITGFAGDYEGDTSLTRYYHAERVTGDPRGAGWESEGVLLAPPDKLAGFLNRSRDKEIAKSLMPAAEAPAASSASGGEGAELDPANLTKEGGKLGSNEGGVFKDKDGNKFYIKRPATKDHVQNELAAARLYQLAGVNTLTYRPVKGGNHVATQWEELDKNRISKMTDAERKAATKDFAIHAWLSNWDAAGTGGDNQGVRNGQPVTLDVGGSLRYRAQGGPKGSAFGNKVTEIDTMRDQAKSYDAGKLFGGMSDEDLKDSVSRVTSIPDEKIRAAAQDDALADTLIARKQDLAKRFGVQAADDSLLLQAADEAQFEESKHPRGPDGKFTSGAGGSSGGEDPDDPFESGAMEEFEQGVQALAKAGKNQYDSEAMQEYVANNTDLAESYADAFPTSSVALALKHMKSKAAPAAQSGPPKTKKEIIAGLLTKQGGTTVKEVLAATGWPAVSMPQQAAAAGLKLTKIKKGGETFYTGTPMTAEEKAALKKGAVAAKAEKVAEKPAAPFVEKVKAGAYNVPPAHPDKPTIPSMDFGEPTPQELEKAKKNVALQMGYVPGPKPELAGGEPMKSAEALLKVFNDKWAGKNIAADPAALKQKVNDFKALGVAMKALKEVETKKHAEIAAQAKAAQAEQAKKLAEKAAAEAKANAEKNKEFMDGLGVGPDQAEGLFALAKMLGQSNSDLVLAFKSYEAKAKSFGYPISGIEAATIMSYSNGSYGSVNKALREGSWTPQQHMYVSMVNKALTKMPKHTGNEKDGTHLIRNTHLSPEEIAYYAEGKVIQEKALMSTSTKKPNGVFSGNVRFLITSKGKRGASIKKLSHYGSEDEVIFKAKTFFKVNKVENKAGGSPSTIIHLEEWEDFD